MASGQALGVVAAERDDDDVGVGRRQLGRQVRRPVEEVGPGQPRRHLVVDRRLGHAGAVEQLLEVRPERAGVAVADDEDLGRRRPPSARPARRPSSAGPSWRRRGASAPCAVDGGTLATGRGGVDRRGPAPRSSPARCPTRPTRRCRRPAPSTPHTPPATTSSGDRRRRRRGARGSAGGSTRRRDAGDRNDSATGGPILRIGGRRDRHPLAHQVGRASTPPSTTSTAPVIQRAAGEARNRQASPTSSGWPSRPSGHAASQRATPSGHASSRPGRSIRPGRHGVDPDARPAPAPAPPPGCGRRRPPWPRCSGCARRRAGTPRSRPR